MEGDKPIFICDFKNCEKIFTTKYSLIRHVQTHMKKKNFKWKQCDKTFTIKQNLIEHEFVHTGEQPYVCGIDGCTQRFRQRGKLSLHRQSHKNYKKKNYRSHTSINDGELTRRVQLGQHNMQPSWIPTNAGQSSVPQLPIGSTPVSNQALLVMSNQMGKMTQLNCGQPLITLSQSLHTQNYPYVPRQVPPNIRFLGPQPGQRMPGVLPKLNLVMMPFRPMHGGQK